MAMFTEVKDLCGRTRRYRVVPKRVKLSCATNGCNGDMVYNGHGFSNSAYSVWDHDCTDCNRTESIKSLKFPYIDYVEDNDYEVSIPGRGLPRGD